MKKYLNTINAFLIQSDWKDLALIKTATAAVGVLMGLLIPKKTRKFAAVTAGLVAVAATVPVILKLLQMFGICEDEQDMFES